MGFQFRKEGSFKHLLLIYPIYSRLVQKDMKRRLLSPIYKLLQINQRGCDLLEDPSQIKSTRFINIERGKCMKIL